MEDLEWVYWSKISHSPKKYLRKSLRFWGSNIINNFVFSNYFTRPSLDLKHLCHDFIRILPNVVKRLKISRVTIRRKEIQHIINSVWSWESVEITYWKFDTKNLKFSNKRKFKITELDFSDWGAMERNDWSNHPDNFLNLIRAISLWPLQKSLSKITLKESSLKKSSIMEIFELYSLTSVQIIL